MTKLVWDSKPWQAFKTFAIIFSFVVNFVLLLVLLLVAPIILPVLGIIVNPLVGGLTESFVQMGDASIVRTIQVDDQIPISFTLPLSTTTDVRLVESVPLNIPATFVLPDGGGQINGNVTINLPSGLILPVQLSLEVPVNQTIPVKLNVPGNIPLADTDLGVPFKNLRGLFEPLNALLSGLPGSNEELIERLLALRDGTKPTVVSQ